MVTGEGKRKQRASIRWKITGAIVLVVLLMGAASLLLYREVSVLGRATGRLASDEYRYLELAEESGDREPAYGGRQPAPSV